MPTTAKPNCKLDHGTYFLPRGYRPNLSVPPDGLADYWNPVRIHDSQRFQHHVYRWAARLVHRFRFVSVLDVGCGPAWKLMHHLGPTAAGLTGIDTPQALAAACDIGVRAELIEADLDMHTQGTSILRAGAERRTFDLVICADVVEHLVDPDRLMNLLREAVTAAGWVLISTPDRDRLRGPGAMACTKPDHVREWARDEFLAYLRSRGFDVVRSRLVPQDDAPLAACRASESAFRAGAATSSLLACHAVLCRVSHARPCGGET